MYKKNKGVSNINWKQVGVATAVGAVAGALSPMTAQSTLGAIVSGEASNTTQYTLGQLVDGKEFKASEAILSVSIGGIGGKFAGSVTAKPSLPVSTASIYIPKHLTQKVNNNMLFYSNTSDQALFRNTIGALPSSLSDIGDLNSYVVRMNTKMSQDTLKS